MHTHAPKTFKRSHKRKREKRNESQSRGGRQNRTKSVAVLAFFLPTVLCVFVLLVTNSLEEFSPSLWLLLLVFFWSEKSLLFSSALPLKKRIIRTSLRSTFSYSHTKTNDIIRTKMALTLTASTVVASVKPTASSNRRCVDVVCARISRRWDLRSFFWTRVGRCGQYARVF